MIIDNTHHFVTRTPQQRINDLEEQLRMCTYPEAYTEIAEQIADLEEDLDDEEYFTDEVLADLMDDTDLIGPLTIDEFLSLFNHITE